MNATLNRIARALGDAPITNRPYTDTERRALVTAAEIQIDKHWSTDMHEPISMWFAGRLAELEVAA